jgi:hypothetical protein
MQHTKLKRRREGWSIEMELRERGRERENADGAIESNMCASWSFVCT